MCTYIRSRRHRRADERESNEKTERNCSGETRRRRRHADVVMYTINKRNEIKLINNEKKRQTCVNTIMNGGGTVNKNNIYVHNYVCTHVRVIHV